MLAALAEGRTVLAPGSQLRSLLVERLERHFDATGRAVWPTPRIREFDGWLRESYESQAAEDPSAPRVLEPVEEREIWREVIGASEEAGGFMDIAGAARAAREAARALVDYRIPPGSLQAFPCAETRALSLWMRSFEARCRELRAVPAHTLPARVGPVELAPVPLEGPDWRPAAAGWLAMHGLAPLAGLRAARGPGVPQVHVHASEAGEAAHCAQWLGARLREDPAFRAFVVFTDLAGRREALTDALDAQLAPGRFGLRESRDAPLYAIAGGTPLTTYEPVWLALESTQALIEPLDFIRFSALLRAPALQASEQDRLASARLDRELRRHAGGEAPLPHWLRAARTLAQAGGLPDGSALQRLTALQEALPAQGAAGMSQWSHRLEVAWSAGPWADRARWSSRSFQAAERLRELLHELARAGASFGSLNLAQAVRILVRAAGDTAFQPQTGAAPVWVSGRALDPWLDVDALWMSGCGADQWPPAPQPLPLLPVQLQRRYGIDGASAEGQSARAHELLMRWRSRASTLVCSTVSQGSTGRVAAIFGEPGPAGEVKEMPHWRAYAEVAPALEERPVNEPAPALPAGPMAGGVGALREQSRCPFRGFAAVRLSAPPLELPQPGFTARERGIILHRCLEHLWRSLETRDALALASTADRAALVAAAAERAVGAAARERNPGELWCDRERRRLEKVLPRWLELEARREPFEVEALESPGRLELAGLQLDLRIDRVDRLADGRRVLLDYKTSSVVGDWYEERPANPQLPAYALASPDRLAGVAYAQVHAAKQRFCGVAEDAQVLPGVATPRSRNLESASLEQELGLWRERLEHIAAELRRGDARVAPSRGACDECLLAGLCRIVRAGSSLIEASGTGEQD